MPWLDSWYMFWHVVIALRSASCPENSGTAWMFGTQNTQNQIYKFKEWQLLQEELLHAGESMQHSLGIAFERLKARWFALWYPHQTPCGSVSRINPFDMLPGCLFCHIHGTEWRVVIGARVALLRWIAGEEPNNYWLVKMFTPTSKFAAYVGVFT